MRDLWAVFGRIGLFSFGGPAAQIALMHQELVEKRGWLTEAQFLRALSFCMLLPGPEAMQLATYAGWKRAGVTGGLIGGGLFLLPGAIVIAALALLYGAYGGLPVVQALFVGIKAVVIVIVIAALIRITARALTTRLHLVIAALAFAALFFLAVPFPVVVALAAVIGLLRPQAQGPTAPLPARIAPSLRILAIGGLLWAAPVLLVVWLDQPFLIDIATFFSVLAVVTFGGAYAVLAYMTQEAVFVYGWLTTAQMVDALGLAETTPGPLILVTQFVAMLAGQSIGGTALALAAGALTLWVTFVPCFIWIFAFAPLIDWLDSRPRLRAALAAITAAVVGVIANLSLWFALHVVFASVAPWQAGPLRMVLPDPASVQPLALGLIAVAALMLMWFKRGLLLTLPSVAFLGLLLQMAAGVL